MSVERVAKPQTELKLPTPSEEAKQTELKVPTPSEGTKQTDLKLPTPSVPTQTATGSKRMSVVTNHTDPKPPSTQHRRRSSAYGSSGINRSRSPRPFEHIAEESEGIEVPPVGKIVWFAKQGLWQALDAFLEKLFQENKVQLRFDPELLPV